jgi:hypothetical protein
MSRIGSGGGSRRDAYADFRSSRELVTKARETAKRWEEETDDRAAPTPEPEGHDAPEPGEALPRIEEAVDEGVRRLQEEAEQLLSATETRIAGLERELRRSQAAEEELARRSAELTAASERQAELADRLATEFSRLYRHRAAFHPASVHLAELQARIKALASELSSGRRQAEEPPG